MSEIDRVLFLDIDGPMIPSRSYLLPNQTKPIVKTFDPCAVALLNDAMKKQNRKIVIHSSWLRYYENSTLHHCISQGLLTENFHPTEPQCSPNFHYRYDRIDDWLSRHKEVTDFMVLDDEDCSPDWPRKNHLILVDFDEGLTWKVYKKILDGTRKIS